MAHGGTEGRPPVTLGTTARVSFVRDPDGNWIEVSQRASLTGSLERRG
jgi:lactoylglutathione lyase